MVLQCTLNYLYLDNQTGKYNYFVYRGVESFYFYETHWFVVMISIIFCLHMWAGMTKGVIPHFILQKQYKSFNLDKKFSCSYMHCHYINTSIIIKWAGWPLCHSRSHNLHYSTTVLIIMVNSCYKSESIAQSLSE